MELKIGNKVIGNNSEPFIIAELSANHLHDKELALRLVDEAHGAGADAFKIQTLTPDSMTIDSDKEVFKIQSGTPWDGRTFYDLYSETPLPLEWHKPIFEKCEKLGMICFSTPYDVETLNYLDQFNPPAYKIASFEIFDLKLIEETARKMKPIIISTGVAELNDIEAAVETVLKTGNDQLILLKCTSAYPTPLNEVNLLTMNDMKNKFNCIVGISDHTSGDIVATSSVALGASVIEKHFTMSRDLGGPDASFSMEPSEFRTMVDRCKDVYRCLGSISYDLGKKAESNKVFSRSLFIIKDLKKGDVLTEDSVRAIRPGFGLKPMYLNEVLGKKIIEDAPRGTPLARELFNE